MKKLFMVLAIASMFIASTTLASTWDMSLQGSVWFDYSGGLGLPVPDNTFEVDVTGETITVVDRVTNIDLPAGVIQTASAPPADIPSPSTDEGEMLTVAAYWNYDGTGDFYERDGDNEGVNIVKSYGPPADTAQGFFDAIVGPTTYGLAIWGVTFNNIGAESADGIMWISQDFDNVLGAAAGYKFTMAIQSTPEIPIPGAVWLLLSGLVGIIGLRRKS